MTKTNIYIYINNMAKTRLETKRERGKKTNRNQVPQWTLTVAASCKVLHFLFVTRFGDFSEPLIEPGDKCSDYLSGISYSLHSGCSSSRSTGTLGSERSGSAEVCLKHSSVLQPDRGLHCATLISIVVKVKKTKILQFPT